MKKFLQSIAVLMAALVITFVSADDAFGQRGEKTLGVAGGFATYNHSGYADLYFQYSFSNRVRIAPEVGYIFTHKGKTGFEASVDVHFPFRVYRGINVYPLTGITYNNWNYKDSDSSSGYAGLDFGAGAEMYLTSNLKISLQAKYSLMKTADGGFFNLGFGYVF